MVAPKTYKTERGAKVASRYEAYNPAIALLSSGRFGFFPIGRLPERAELVSYRYLGKWRSAKYWGDPEALGTKLDPAQECANCKEPSYRSLLVCCRGCGWLVCKLCFSSHLGLCVDCTKGEPRRVRRLYKNG